MPASPDFSPLSREASERCAILIASGLMSWFGCRIGLGGGWWGVNQSWETGKQAVLARQSGHANVCVQVEAVAKRRCGSTSVRSAAGRR